MLIHLVLKMPFVKKMMDLYKGLNFKDANGGLNQKTICQYTTEYLIEDGLNRSKGKQKALGFDIYPSEYFAPIHFITRRLHVRENTRTIHRYMASWTDQKNKTIKELYKHPKTKTANEKTIITLGSICHDAAGYNSLHDKERDNRRCQ